MLKNHSTKKTKTVHGLFFHVQLNIRYLQTTDNLLSLPWYRKKGNAAPPGVKKQKWRCHEKNPYTNAVYS